MMKRRPSQSSPLRLDGPASRRGTGGTGTPSLFASSLMPRDVATVATCAEGRLLMSAMDERTAIRSRTRAGLWRLAGPWWMFLLTGVAWLILSWVALRFTPASVPTVGVLLGVVFLVAMVNEFFIAAVRASWRWLHVVMGVIFAFGAGWSFARPYNAFWTLASILGLLLIFRGTLDIITSASTREVNSACGLACWPASWRSCSVSGPPSSTSRYGGALLLVWVGFFALFRGISEIVIAFELRRAQHP